MLFNSYEFIFLFLPVTLVIYHLLLKLNYNQLSVLLLTLASLLFYGWWNSKYLILICGSIVFNYLVGSNLLRSSQIKIFKSQQRKKILLVFGITGNLSLLGYYKYSAFFVNNINYLLETNYMFTKLILPLAISFFTFQQITFLVDSYNQEAKEYSFLNYCLFVTFFPQLISGPIVHHREMMPQFEKRNSRHSIGRGIIVGFVIFIIGLFKKVVLADGIAPFSDLAFTAAENNIILNTYEAWTGVLAYTFQIYFDFSGYSDMAIGLGRMFGIYLPLNFHSPYKSLNIIGFWRRWHMTLSKFLREYLYIPLGGNRKGIIRRYGNLFITMLLGGLWHGAGWTFVVWGLLHGFYLIINHWFISFKTSIIKYQYKSNIISKITSWLITFFAVTIAWVFFRAESFTVAYNILRSMILFDLASNSIADLNIALLINLIVLFIIVIMLPNTQEYMFNYKPPFEVYRIKLLSPTKRLFKFDYNIKLNFVGLSNALTISLLLLLIVIAMTTNPSSTFLYYQF